ncbi:hypothetical protein CQA66_08200 [Helicobacter aurati]|uniref:Uncharacterized protein n=1 Tax=Helicobacter aurati TaxID=137778 RepID=A0A3D8IYN3_9HELI|nr:hypothetical protein [Helicobacter aurati]RDU70379.1 hypothetical protein CQA66_08200 [Helicobacter aurati]
MPALPNITGQVGGIRATEMPYASGCNSVTAAANNRLGAGGYTVNTLINTNAKLCNPIYKDNHNDVTPFNFNLNIDIKV